jgi:hypothetical protein
MPKYYVYNKQTGDIVHSHESYSSTNDTSLRCSRDEVLALVDDNLQKDNLEILEVEGEKMEAPRSGGGRLRVDPKARTLVAIPR